MSDNARNACATIRGYNYQFDATILSIIDLHDDDSLTVEGLEDFDIEKSDSSELFQCKYYAAEKLTSSTIRDAILPMLTGFVGYDKPHDINRKYHLYGFFQDSIIGTKTLTVQELQECLKRREKVATESGETKYITISIQEEIGASDEDLVSFADRLEINICSEYQEHLNDVITKLQRYFCISREEAECFCYPSAFTFVAHLASNSSVHDRVVNKSIFRNNVRTIKAQYTNWLIQEKGKQAYCKNIRGKYFSTTNIDKIGRFFVIEVECNEDAKNLLSVMLEIRRKWSSHTLRRKPDKERYAPYVYFKGLSADKLILLKRELERTLISFVDGYTYLGAEFSIENISKGQTYENKISLRIVSADSDLFRTLEYLREPTIVFDFYKSEPSLMYPENQRCVSVSTLSITDIIEMI